ncbi:MAG: (Fe-S)-binding protein [Elusimicrobia bacterium]|nr:(Fe-S)-binding protein [Elusimicrobiota bacterium]
MIPPLYDAVSQCNRCGYCLQACPTYVLTGREAFSGRGRNQIFRMMLEGRLPDPRQAQEALSSCLLCGACTSVCFAHVPTAAFVLEGRRRISGQRGSLWVRWLFYLLEERNRTFRWFLRGAYFLKRLGLSRLLSRLGVFRVLGWKAIEKAEEHIGEVPLQFLSEILPACSMHPESDSDGAGCAPRYYFAACGSNYLYPSVGLATWRLLRPGEGVLRYASHGCCGLLEHHYGRLDRAQELAKSNIQFFEGRAALVADCSSCAAYLKSYPQLLGQEPDWAARAQDFSSRVKDVLEILPLEERARSSRLGDRRRERVTYHDSCRARHGQGIWKRPRELLQGLPGVEFVELTEPEWCCGGAGTYAFVEPELSEEILRRKMENVRKTAARWILTSSTSCIMQLRWGCRRWYPEGKVLHLVEFLSGYAAGAGMLGDSAARQAR